MAGSRVSKSKPSSAAYRCGECGWTASKWQGRCGECQAWGTVIEVGAPRLREVTVGPVTAPALPIQQVPADATAARTTGVDELDRVLGGGLVPGSVVLVAGEPGVGKSTLLLEVAARSAGPGHRSLYLTGEESAAQVRRRGERVGAVAAELYLAAETDLSAVLGQIEHVDPSLLVVDSVQTIGSAEIEGAPGGVTQVKEVAAALIRVAKERGMATLLIGHVTKDGSVAGPRTLEHLVDVVLAVEGERHARLRLVRAQKNRYGPADEIGCFELAEDGIWGMPDPSGLFLTQRARPSPGSCVTVTLEGTRPLLAEVQALVVPTSAPVPRRQTSGLDTSRVAMVSAVLDKQGLLHSLKADTYVATVGGVRITEPAADLAVALAVGSSQSERMVHQRLVAFGDIGLSGEIRRVTGAARRLSEAARLGYTHALVPPDSGPAPDGLVVREVELLADAFDLLLP
ncbi:MAG TPA: DNA repair protein RadA [Candidatus Nanopelagicales bacterium]|nr:DNA repair protein RadA [Candidatus Nanopelagicales bacterium]